MCMKYATRNATRIPNPDGACPAYQHRLQLALYKSLCCKNLAVTGMPCGWGSRHKARAWKLPLPHSQD